VKEWERVRRWLAIAVALYGLAHAERAAAQRPFERIWIDVDAAVASAPADVAVHAEILQPVEAAEFEARYPVPRAAALNVGAGFMVTPRVGIGASVGATRHLHAAEISLRIPHPFFANTFASDNGETDYEMQRIERSLHLQAVFVAVNTPRVRVRAFAGPTMFRMRQDAVTEIIYNHFYFVRLPTNFVEITGYDLKQISGTGWGLHGGADAALFFTDVLGVGGFARFSRGTVDMENTLATALDLADRVSVKAGGVEIGAGVRLKF
jgi:hypothetical protein